MIGFRLLDIKIEGCDKLPTTLCQQCTAKVEDLQNFYNNCHDAQKILAVQFSVSDEGCLEDSSIIISSSANTVANLVVKEDHSDTVPSTTSATLSTDKLLETAIKDTCILSGEEESEESDTTDSLSDEEHSTAEDKV